MKLTRTREFVVNMGNYESLRLSASVEVNYATDENGNLSSNSVSNAEKLLDDALKNDLLEAAKLSDVRNTYVLTWNSEHYGDK